MSTMSCNDFMNYLEGWMEGERPAESAAHLQGCPNCRSLLEDLESIQVAGRSMETDTAPPERVWTSLRAQLEQEGLIQRQTHDWTAGLRSWFGGVFSAVPRPALAGAYMVALVAVGAALSIPGYRHVNQLSAPAFSASLDSAEHETLAMGDSDPAVAASLQKNLAIVDNYIALCEKSVQEEPENEDARDFLYDAYEQKADLLAEIAERGDGR
jgi:hypothetical protein